jgi:uncharacterized protein YndB with AHSA1/START domain
MTERSVTHATFVVERTFAAAPARVFAAFATVEGKSRWFGAMDGWELLDREFDFRPGGRERLKGRWASGTVSDFEAHYYDVVPDERIVYAYEMHIDDARISVSLATVEFKPAGSGTRLVVTEQGAFLDGYDDAGRREHGTGFLLDALAAALDSETATA